MKDCTHEHTVNMADPEQTPLEMCIECLEYVCTPCEKHNTCVNTCGKCRK